MKTLLTSLKFVPVYGLAALILGAFACGATINARYVPNSDVSVDELPSNWLVGGIQVTGVALLVGSLFIIAAGLRYLAYARIEKFTGRRWWLTGPAAALEAALAAILIWSLWAATEPVMDSGFILLVYVQLSVVVLVASIVILIAALFFRRRQPAAGLAA